MSNLSDNERPLTLFNALLYYLKPVAVPNLIGVGALCLHACIVIMIPSIIKDIFNGWETGELTRAALNEKCLWIVGLAMLSALTMFWSRWLIIGASRTIEMRLRNDLFTHVLSLTPRFFHNMRTGDLMTRFASDIEAVRLLVGPGVMYPGQTVLVVILAFYAMMTTDATLTMTILVPVVILFAYVNFLTRKMHRYYRQAQDIYSELAARVQENLAGIRVVKAFCQEQAEYERFREVNDRYIDRNLKQVELRGRLFPFMKMVGGVGLVLILWVGGIRVIEDQMTLGELVQFAFYYQLLMWPIIAMGWIINVIHRGVASWRRIRAVLETPPDVLDPDHGDEQALQGGIEIRDLTFSYGPDLEPVLKQFHCDIKPGQTLAIVGPTGCGKSTVVNLLLHLYAVPRGSIFYEGRDICDIPREVLRNSIAYISQEVFLFSDTIHNNIRFGIDDEVEISELEIEEAAQRAQLAQEIANFPDGYQTRVGERGITLSGGQKQRTGIARALILNRPILILDDCLSAVDTNTEEAILRGLSDAMHRSTCILISHRISTVKNADHIIVLEDGGIAEEGTHDQLVEHGGLYSQMHNRQLLEDSLGIRS
ncbi:MAG: ABC transporter ATP-binding protein [Candidatus Hinthialibacter antarcticus]|nr:ABC transporter ATP-binding protein [Candidatus Hinthialibacter antarcticus]